MIDKILDTIREHKLLHSGDTVTVALSGGADSVALTHALFVLSQTLQITVKAVHVNHCLRGAESDRDMAFVKDFCDNLAIPLKIFMIDIHKIAADTKQGIELAARNARYACFASLDDAGKIATAHNQDDLAETVLLNLIRGSGTNGMQGIPLQRDHIIRPLLYVSRDEIMQYLKDNHLSFVLDSSNISDIYTRNKIRHHVMPVLKQINPAFLQSVTALSRNAAQDEAFIQKTADALLRSGASLQQLQMQPVPVLKRYVKSLCKGIGVPLENKHLQQALQVLIAGKGKCQLPNDNFFWIEKQTVRVGCPLKAEPFCLPLKEGICATPYQTYRIKIIEKKDEFENVHNLLFKNQIDYDKISACSVLRSKRDGDSIRLWNRKCTKSLKKLFNEQKIPCDDRFRLAVIADETQVFWCERFGVSETAAVSETTKKILLIEITNEQE